MSTNADLFHTIADAFIEAHGQNATEWLECGGRAAIGRGVAGWRAAIAEDAWLDRPEEFLVLWALQHIEDVVELAGGARIKARIRALVDEDWNRLRQGARARIGEVFAHEVLLGDTGDEHGWTPVDVGEGRVEAGLPRALVEQLRQLLRPRRFARRMQVLRSIEQRVPG